MTRHRQPLRKAILTGAVAKNPQRYRDRKEPPSAGPIGDPPDCLSPAERNAWVSFAASWPWITREDRAALVALCQMRVLVEQGTDLTAAMLNAYRLMLSEFGGTPQSRTRVSLPRDDEDDAFAAFDDPLPRA